MVLDAIAVIVRAVGSVMVAVADVVHPLLSVTVTVYEPAASPDAVAVVCTGVVFHEYVYGAVPLVAVTGSYPSCITEAKDIG